jgi:hypothetical protein
LTPARNDISLVIGYNVQNSIFFMRSKASGSGYSQALDPCFRQTVTARHMDMYRFLAVLGVEEKTETFRSQYGWHNSFPH